MTVISHKFSSSIEHEITQHPAWLGNISGLKAERMLRNQKKSFLYVLRQGEHEGDYYVTFTLPDLTVKHQPFMITHAAEGWYCINGCGTGPHTAETSIDDVIHCVMHCEKDECAPLAITE